MGWLRRTLRREAREDAASFRDQRALVRTYEGYDLFVMSNGFVPVCVMPGSTASDLGALVRTALDKFDPQKHFLLWPRGSGPPVLGSAVAEVAVVVGHRPGQPSVFELTCAVATEETGVGSRMPVVGTQTLSIDVSDVELGQAVRDLYSLAPEPAPSLLQTWSRKCGWYAVLDCPPEAIIEALGCGEMARPHRWTQDARTRGLFVSPQVGHWTWIAGKSTLSDVLGAERMSGLLQTEVQFFGSHRGAEAYGWTIANRGLTVRAFESVGGGLEVDSGTKAEHEARELAATTNLDEDAFLRIAAGYGVDHQRIPVAACANSHGYVVRMSDVRLDL